MVGMASQEHAKPAEIVVFSILRDSECAECKMELERGDFLRMENEKPMCLSCSDLDHLVYLPRGDVAVTRRARKYSKLSPVVVRFSRTRKRYERQGVLVEEEALARAETECLEDADARARSRARAAVLRDLLDQEYVREFAAAIASAFPGCPESARGAIAEHACRKHSGRVGRSASAKRFEKAAVELAVQAHVRHVHTDYHELLARGIERGEARARVRRRVDALLDSWR
jgi:hypothetical protein